MSRRLPPSPVRCVLVWLLVTAVALGTWHTAAGAAGSLASTSVWHSTFEALLVAIASAALVASVGWLWIVTTVTVIAVARGRVPSAVPRGAARRLVLVACGVAVVAGVGSPALASTHSGDRSDTHSGAHSGAHSLAGLPMPDRAVVGTGTLPAPAQAPAPVVADRPAHRHPPSVPSDPGAPITVRAGDSLWSIAADRLGPGADVAAIDAAWRELYAANIGAIGDNADLILPGLELEQGPNREARP